MDLFKEFDKDKSGYIDEEELCEMMRALEMDHSLAKAKEMMLEIDEDGSGELEFGEFCALLAKVKRGDVGNLHGFAKLTEDIKATPVSVLNIEVLKRGLKSKYRFVETREATAMYDKYEVMEVNFIRALVRDRQGPAQGVLRRPQLPGHRQDDARSEAGRRERRRGRSYVPRCLGIKFPQGVIPFEWSDWCRKNLEKGALLEDLLKTLTTKGFHPAKNPGFMEKFLLIRSWAYAFGEIFLRRRRSSPSPSIRMPLFLGCSSTTASWIACAKISTNQKNCGRRSQEHVEASARYEIVSAVHFNDREDGIF